jgi:hypothetical protein
MSWLDDTLSFAGKLLLEAGFAILSPFLLVAQIAIIGGVMWVVVVVARLATGESKLVYKEGLSSLRLTEKTAKEIGHESKPLP